MTGLEAISALTALTNLALRSAEAAQRVSSIIEAAQTEGRTLTAAETREIQSMREDAIARWNEAGHK